jgi:hypothetical protein
MPVLSDDCYTYGFVNENRHMTESFLNEELPMENWEDGLFVIEILMASYMAAEKGKKIKFPPEGLEEYIPKVAKGEWNAKSIIEVSL